MSPSVLFANGAVGVEVLEHLIACGDAPRLCVLHPEPQRRKGERFERLCGQTGIPIICPGELSPERLASGPGELAVSAYYGYILKPDIIRCFERGIINFHPGLLPHNRGTNSNVWPLVDGSPAGVSLHYIDAEIDTGPLLLQRSVQVLPSDSAQTLHGRLERAMVDLFREHWPALRDGRIDARPQPPGGSLHYRRELALLKNLDMDARMTMREAINLLRACTFPPHPGAHFEIEGRRYQVEINIEEVEPCS